MINLSCKICVELKIFRIKRSLILLFSFLHSYFIFANSSDLKPTQLTRVGNFSLTRSQQPAPLIGFGQTIIDKNQWQVFLYTDAFIGKDNYFTDIVPMLLYGIRDDLSILVNIPVTPSSSTYGQKISGLEDISVQLEYAFIERNLIDRSHQATALVSISAPTGEIHKSFETAVAQRPVSGVGAMSVFVGSTYSYMQTDWYTFVAPGALFTTANSQDTKYGNEVWYQFGFGRNIPSPKGSIFTWLVEIDGQYNWRNKVRGRINPHSGGNVIYVTPSLWYSTKNFIAQFGVGYPFIQILFGQNQPSKFLSLAFNFVYTF